MKVTNHNFKESLRIVLSINQEIIDSCLCKNPMSQYTLARRNIQQARLVEKLGEIDFFS